MMRGAVWPHGEEAPAEEGGAFAPALVRRRKASLKRLNFELPFDQVQDHAEDLRRLQIPDRRFDQPFSVAPPTDEADHIPVVIHSQGQLKRRLLDAEDANFEDGQSEVGRVIRAHYY